MKIKADDPVLYETKVLPPVPAWMRLLQPLPDGTCDDTRLKKDQYEAKIDKWLANDEAVIFTDGSAKCENNSINTGAAFVTFAQVNGAILEKAEDVPTIDCFSALDAEIEAVQAAVNLACVFDQRCHILTDSLSTVTALKKGRIINRKLIPLYDSLAKPGKIHLHYIPGHSGIKGNVLADRRAKSNCNASTSTHPKMNFYSYIQILNDKILSPPDKETMFWLNQPRKRTRIATRLKCEAYNLNRYLYVKGIVKSPLCEACMKVETLDHFLYDCKKYKHLEHQRDKMRQNPRDLTAKVDYVCMTNHEL